ncbi:YitT family protein [Actinobacillus indolicus]|uniref:YitT family protein n=1 Tax=Actinobacillus indolicus TaxID=51049 RepID=A0A4P7CJB1_9PAST|nr:YitT family protein [Actinobacillus indolicus]QBQ64175.1 YitT family protein [Actinobacillus indolicus]
MSRKSPIPNMPWTAEHQWQLKPSALLMISIATILMGIGEGLLVLAHLGSSPWTVFSQGVALQTGLSIGTVVAIISVIVLLLWIPLQLRFGLGTILNIFWIALFIDLTVQYVPAPEHLVSRFLLMIGAILLFGISTTFYLSCHLGAGPRDGLMVGMCQKYGWRVGVVRTSIEVTVCVLGFLLGGTVGISTLAFALCVGWIIQYTATLFSRYKRSDLA